MPDQASLPPIAFRAYGRGVQQLVAEAMATPDRVLRQQKAEQIVATMALLTQQKRSLPEVEQKLWMHLAQMANYELDVDYPVPIVRPEEKHSPQPLPASQAPMRLRHYGRHLEQAMELLAQTEQSEERVAMIRMLVARMRRCLNERKGEATTVGRIAHDIATYTEGRVSEAEVEAALI